MSNQLQWLEDFDRKLPCYLNDLGCSDQVGSFDPCLKGLTPIGRQARLGFSCLALKVFYMVGLWTNLPGQQQREWIEFIQSFQVEKNPLNTRVAFQAFLDPAVVRDASRFRLRQFAKAVLSPRRLTHLQRVIIGETKQAIATLAQVCATAKRSYQGFPDTDATVYSYLHRLDWTQPWDAGAHVAALVVFLRVEAPKFVSSGNIEACLEVCREFLDEVSDDRTGSYFSGSTPGHGHLVNGAMKVLTGLDWLDEPIHKPEQLIDTCLVQLPNPEGCYLVDAVYVLHQCLRYTDHRKEEVQTHCRQILDMVRSHVQPDGGFSYYLGRSQTSYYGVPITKGLDESDIHGTCLLTWAVAMILEILEIDRFKWQVIRP